MRWASIIEIAGISFSGCRGEIQNGVQFLTPFKGSVEHAASGKPHVQHVNTQYRGLQYGIIMVSVEQDKFNDMVAAIRTAQLSGSTFVTRFVDEVYNINVNAYVDYTREWVTHGQPSSGMIPNVALSFISHSLV